MVVKSERQAVLTVMMTQGKSQTPILDSTRELNRGFALVYVTAWNSPLFTQAVMPFRTARRYFPESPV
jgi:hypothetical protein